MRTHHRRHYCSRCSQLNAGPGPAPRIPAPFFQPWWVVGGIASTAGEFLFGRNRNSPAVQGPLESFVDLGGAGFAKPVALVGILGIWQPTRISSRLKSLVASLLEKSHPLPPLPNLFLLACSGFENKNPCHRSASPCLQMAMQMVRWVRWRAARVLRTPALPVKAPSKMNL